MSEHCDAEADSIALWCDEPPGHDHGGWHYDRTDDVTWREGRHLPGGDAREKLAAAITRVREARAVPLARYAVTADELAGELLDELAEAERLAGAHQAVSG